MGKKMKLIPFLTQSKSLDSSPSSWTFPSCGNIKTLSFRYKEDNFTTFNSAFIDSTNNYNNLITSTPDSLSFSTMSDHNPTDPIESGLQSDRLFFEPEQSCSLLQQKQEEEEKEKETGDDPVENEWVMYSESEAMGMESNNPCEDFRKSMEEMVEAHGLKDWKGLEELLGCYLKINHKNNHRYIMSAFIDLLINLSFISSSTSTSTTTTTTTTTTNTSSISTQSSNNNNINSSSSTPSSPLSLPSSSSSLTIAPSLSSLFYHDPNHNLIHY